MTGFFCPIRFLSRLLIGRTANKKPHDHSAVANCESSYDCHKDARCIRRECHCFSQYGYGDGKTKCETHPYIRKNPCLSDKNCPKYSRCHWGSECECRDELKGDGEICNPGDPVSCSSDSDCKSAQGICYDGYCRCTGFFAGNGKYCRAAIACPANTDCGDNAECYIDPFFPEKTECRCKIGFRRNMNTRKCIECFINEHCTKTYSICDSVQEKCTCEQELIIGETKCEAAPLHPCKDDIDCSPWAKCEEDKCICQGYTVGNGAYCRTSDPCPNDFQCGHGTCLKDPLMPKDQPVCRCDKGYFNNKEGKCVDCLSDNDCNKDYSTCDNGTCKCKDELIKEGQKTCKRAPQHPCNQDGDCHNKADCIQGKCYCRGKLTGNGQFCRASLACPAALDKCGDQDVCVVDLLFPNEPECKCREGTARTSADGKCEVVTECFKRGFVCPSLSSCDKVKGNYICVCKKGYELKSVGGGLQAQTICQDIDECMTTKPCSSNSVCVNSKGGYQCKCDAGYRNNAKNKDICEDLDECSELVNPCGGNQKCVNYPGTYTCLCDAGYVRTAGGCIKPGRALHHREQSSSDNSWDKTNQEEEVKYQGL
ncbi:hypothetical protein ACROYT_G023878 [Oculina patagonica]